MPYLSALEVCSQRGAVQIHVYLTVKLPDLSLHSSTAHQLQHHPLTTPFADADRSFSVVAPILWHLLPPSTGSDTDVVHNEKVESVGDISSVSRKP